MTKDEWLALPPLVALGVLYDIAEAKLSATEAPPVPRPPKYDGRLSKKGGYVWLSEMTPSDLAWWREKKRESAEGGGQYAEKDAKTLKAIDAFLAWRTAFPYETWSGIRGEDRVNARPPSRDPAVHEWRNDGGGGQRRNTQSSKSGGSRPAPRDDDNDFEEIDEESIPF